MVEEKVFLNESGFLVTNTRFEIPGQMFAMAGVTSVGVNQVVPSKLWPIVMMILGKVLMTMDFGLKMTARFIHL